MNQNTRFRFKFGRSVPVQEPEYRRCWIIIPASCISVLDAIDYLAKTYVANGFKKKIVLSVQGYTFPGAEYVSVIVNNLSTQILKLFVSGCIFIQR